MPHEHWLVVETRKWLERAWEDLEGAGRLLQGPGPLTNIAVFHAQQAAEKSLKAFLTFKGIDFEKTHDLRELGALAQDPTLTEAIARAEPLTRYAVVGRYPSDQPPATLDEARESLASARELYDAILASLPEETRPQDA